MYTGFAKDLLEVADILSMAIGSVPKDEIKTNTALKSLYDGVTMTEKQLQSIFRRHGIVQINPGEFCALQKGKEWLNYFY